MICKRCYSEIDDSCLYCPNCNAPTGDNPLNVYGSDHKPWHPMKWYKFLIYFALFAGAALNLFSAVSMLSGSYYAADYARFAGLRTTEIVFGVALLVLVALMIVARFRLAAYRRNGPILLYTVYITTFLLQLATCIVYPVVLHISFLFYIDFYTIVNFIEGILLLVLNRIYFKKRRFLFRR